MRSLSKRWLALTVIIICLIWGNSLVPASGSNGLSLSVLDAVRDALASLGLPVGWVTNFVVRKTAHFCEYLALGFCASHALDAERRPARGRLASCALLLVLVPSIDETIQLFVPGRSGQVTDVLLDCCGAATGVALSYLVSHLVRTWRAHHADAGDGDAR